MSQTTEKMQLDEVSEELLQDLAQPASSVLSWNSGVVNNLQLIRDVYTAGSKKVSEDSKVRAFLERVKGLERCVRVDIGSRIMRQDHRTPLYLGKTLSILKRAQQNLTETNGLEDCIHSCFGDLSAELLAVILDHGFCGSLVVIDPDEATTRINQMSRKLDAAHHSSETYESLLSLSNIIADQWALHYSVSRDNMNGLLDKMEKLDLQTTNVEKNVSMKCLNLNSDSFKKYIHHANFIKSLSTDVVDDSFNSKILAQHTWHSSTCEWLFERLDSWIEKSDSQTFLLAGRAGTGKSCFASAVCKRYPKDVVAAYAFDKSATIRNHNRVTTMISVLAKQLTQSLPEYAAAVEKIKETPISVILNKGWRNMYEAFLEDPLALIFGSKPRTPRSPQRHPETYSHKIILIDGIDECLEAEWEQLRRFFSTFLSNIHPKIGLLLTIRNKHQATLVPLPNENISSVFLESRSLSGRHVNDIELYIAGCLGVLLSDEDDAGYLHHAKTDAMTLQDTVDELLKASSGRFDYAIHVVMAFAKSMGGSGQFLSSIKKTLIQMQQKYGGDFERRKAEFAPLFRAYRDKEGRHVVVKVLRHGRHLLERSRAVLVTHKSLHQI